MVKARKIPEEPEVKPSVDPIGGTILLKKQIEKAKNLLSQDSIDWADYTAWKNTTKGYLIKVFGSKSQNVNAVIHASSSTPSHTNMDEYEIKTYTMSLIENQIKMLGSCIEQLETEIELSKDDKGKVKNEEEVIINNNVFVVHGSNDGVKEAVARFINKLNLNPIILHEQPNLGRTLIEKFTDYSNVGFAIVILTGDDLGKGSKESDLNKRARQNVIFELGYFIGKLGRARVCALYEEGVEFPSDYEG
ncbi:MAG: nucleotide-binding protein, partial [Elusimicrobiota bacterium]